MVRPALRPAACVCAMLASLAAAAHQQPPSPTLQPLPVTRLDERQRPLPTGALPVTRIDEQRRESLLDQGPPFSLSFAEPQRLRELLVLLVRGTRLSVVIDPGVEGTFVGELNHVTLRQALDAILHPLGLDYAVDGTVIHVFTVKVETRIFNIDYVVTRRTGARTVNAPTGVGGAPRAAVSSIDETDLFEDITNALKTTLLSSDGRFNVDRKAGLLQVTDYPARLDRVSTYLETALLRVHRQVLIQAQVIEVLLRDPSQGGVDWSRVFDAAAVGVRPRQTVPPGAFAGTLGVAGFQGLLAAIAAQGDVNVLSTPRVVAMNNEPAVMRVGTEDVYFAQAAPQAVTEGLVLSITPQISADGVITMSISPSVTERTGQATSKLGETVPVISVRETDTLVRVREGETVVMAGLLQDRSTSTGRRERTNRKSDLVILLTPRLMTLAGTGAEP